MLGKEQLSQKMDYLVNPFNGILDYLVFGTLNENFCNGQHCGVLKGMPI